MVSAGVPSAIIRFACHLPLGYLAFDGVKYYNSVKNLEVIHLLPHGATFLKGLRIVAGAGRVGFWWNFLLWIPTAHASGILLEMIGLVDLAIAISLLCAVIFQSAYLPHSKATCQNAETWRNSNGSSNFFHVASNLSAFTGETPQDVCHDYFTIWTVGVAIVVLYMLSAGLNITLGILTNNSSDGFYHDPLSTPSTQRLRRFSSSLCGCLLSPILQLFTCTTVRLRYVSRYLAKSRRKPKGGKPIKLRSLDTKIWKHDQTTALTVALSPELQQERYGHPPPYSLLMLIASELHYADIVNWSLASQSTRQLIFPRLNLASRSEALRIQSCENGSKVQCWICTNQICRSCSARGTVPDTEASVHRKACRPTCSKCYYTSECRLGRSRHADSCELGRRPCQRDGLHYGSAMREVCRTCDQMAPRMRQSRREARDGAEIERLAQQPLVCWQCGMALPDKGPRWWVCSMCRGECRHRIHPAWAEKMEV